MARSNPNASFEAAAKHLFRHIHRADRLRTNPLARPLFESGGLQNAVARERVAVAQLHELFRSGAERARDSDLVAGKPERARRHYALAMGHLQGTAVRAIANALGIASSQCYRERAEVCLRIAAYVRDALAAGTPVAVSFDDFRYGLDRAANVAELGDPRLAIAEYERLRGRAGTAARAIETACELALMHVRLDAAFDAARALEDARLTYRTASELSERERTIAGARIAYADGMATWARDPSLGMELFAHAVESLEPLVEASDAAAELHARVLFEYGESRATFHDLHGSIVTLARARAAASACRRPSPFLVLRTEIALRMFRNSVLEDPRGWEPLNRRLTEMREVAAAAHATGSVDLSLRALNAVAQLEAASGDASAALYAARSALALSNYHPAAEVYSETVVRMARTVMYTPLWQEVPALLHRAGPPATIAVAAQRRTLEAEYALRTKSYAHARQLLAQHRGAPRPFMNVLAAQAAHALGSPREACRQIEAALPAVERSGIAKTIERTYRIAARVTGDGRFGRKAEEIARAIGA